jgi:hypothetical protein
MAQAYTSGFMNCDNTSGIPTNSGGGCSFGYTYIAIGENFYYSAGGFIDHNTYSPGAPVTVFAYQFANVCSNGNAEFPSTTYMWDSSGQIGTSFNFGTNDSGAFQYATFNAPMTPGTYTLYMKGNGGAGDTTTGTLTYTVIATTPTASLTSSPTTITAGQSTNLTASCTNSTSASINNGAPGIGASGGTVSVSPTDTTTYTLTCNNGSGGTDQDQVTVTVNPAVPTTPTGLSASPSSCGTGQVNVSWTAVSGATSYELRDSTNTVIYNGAGTSFNHTGLAAGSSQSYTVRATNSSGSSAYSSSVSATAPAACATAPATPTGISATQAACGTGRINVSWGSVSGASGYDLQIDGGSWFNVGNVTSYANTEIGRAHV